MKFLHGYVPGFWNAYERRGLLDENSGIRYCQSIDIPEALKFNNLAAEGGEFYNLVKELRCPLYIDRLQGGCFFEGYDYDMSLISKYENMLGGSFYGFQMHEWMSNFVSDTQKLTEGGCPEPWTEQNIISTIRRRYDYQHIFTEAMSPAELAEAGHITDIDIYIETMERLFGKRQKYTGNKVVPCDSAALGYPVELKGGAERIMAETGQQTPHTSIQVAYARGMSRAYNRSFGTYYEPWGGFPFSACNYHKNSANEWNIAQESFPFQTAGGNGGSSRSLQKRICLYSYISGADFFSEEWGAYNTFRDCEDFELTEYGQIKLDCLRFMRKYPDIGKPLTPIAAVIPKEIKFLDNIDSPPNNWLSFTPSAGIDSLLSQMREGLRYLYASAETYGNENGALVNSILPDAFDIVNEDVFNADKYAYAINLTGKNGLEKETCKCIGLEEVDRVLGELLPCKVEGGLHHIINKSSDGKYYLTVFNNTGIIRSVQDGELCLKEAEKTVSVSVKDFRQLTMLEGDAVIRKENGLYFITVPAGGFFFGSL